MCVFPPCEESRVTFCGVIACFQKRKQLDTVTFEEEAARKDPSLRKSVKEIAAEMEKAEGRGQLRVRDLYCLCTSHRSEKVGCFSNNVVTHRSNPL